MTPIRMIAATGLLGYGFTEEGFHNGLADGVDFSSGPMAAPWIPARITLAPASRS